MTGAVLPDVLKNLFDFIDGNVDLYIDRLKEAVEIPSVSAIPENRQDVIKMVHWMSGKLKDLGVTTEIFNIGTQSLPCGKVIDLPPVLLGQLGKDPRKRTVLIYGHLDVQPATKSDGWDTNPFLLSKKDGKLFGRGSSDDKGPSVGWLNAIEAFKALNYDIPVNIKFVFEGMEECGSAGLENFLTSHQEFLEDVDCVCVSDSRWLGMKTPCLTYGLRGNCYFHVEVECAKSDLHSGSFGGSVHEAMADLIFLLDSLIDSCGKILIPGVYEDVEPVTDSEIKLYNDVDFCVLAFKRSAGCEQLLQGDDKINVLMSTWRYPSLSIHGIQGAFSDSGSKTVIPKKVIGKFSIRIVPNQKPEKIGSLVINYLEGKWKSRNSPNKFKTTMSYAAKPWITSVSHYNYVAARKATKYAYGKEPDLTRIGGSIPITLTFQEITGKNVLVLPIGAGDDNAHSQNEKINIENYIGGSKLMAAYIYELGLV